MAIEEPTESTTPVSLSLSRATLISWESLLVIALAILAVASRLWMLGTRVMSHDESLHVYFSWLFSTGQPYAHNPMMHGPLLFEATAFIDRLFGASDFTSRLLPAILGVFLVVVVPQLLKPWLGKTGALATGLLLLVSPYITYFSRYIRHDIPTIAWASLAVLAVFRYLDKRRDGDLLLLASALALMVSTMETSFIYMAILVSFLVFSMLVKQGLSLNRLRHSAEFDLLVVIATLGAFFSSPIALLVLNPVWVKATGAPFVDVKVLDTQSIGWAVGTTGLRLWGLLVVFSIAAVIIGMAWDWKRWPLLAAVFGAITLPLFTTFFTNTSGIGSGFIGSLGYWLSQQGVARGSQPWYYYLVVFPVYEYLPIIAGFFGAIFFLRRATTMPESERTFVAFLIWWAGLILFGLSAAGEKMPWLSTHLTIPFILLSGWWIGQLIERLRAPSEEEIPGSKLPGLLALSGVAVLLLMTIHTSIAANYINYDYVTEFIDYAHGAPGVKQTMADIDALAGRTGAGADLKVAYDDQVSWPMTWYLRKYRNQGYYGADPNPPALDAPVVLAGPKNWAKVEAILGNRYQRFEVIRIWWPMEDYKNTSWERIRFALTNAPMRAALWSIFWDRDYTPYAALTGEVLQPPVAWPLQESMRVYIRKDVAAQLPNPSLGKAMLEDVTPTVDPYASVHLAVSPQQLIGDAGLLSPRGLAVASDGSIYVVDTGNSRIVHFNADGGMISAWGGPTQPGQVPPAPSSFMEPWGVAVDKAGNVYVADTWNHRIQKFDANGNFLLEWGITAPGGNAPGPMWGPRGIAVGPDGRVYVTDTGNKRVLVFDENGKFLSQFDGSGAAALDEPVGIALGMDGRVYVADTWNMRVAVFSQDGLFLASWPVQGWTGDSPDNKPYLAVDAENRVYITDPQAGRVVVFSADGKPVAEFTQMGPESDSYGMPAGMAVTPDGRVWVSDAANGRLAGFEVWK